MSVFECYQLRQERTGHVGKPYMGVDHKRRSHGYAQVKIAAK